MRRTLIIVIAAATLIVAAYNFYLLLEAGMLLWAIAFALSVPILAAVRAWFAVRAGDERLALAAMAEAALVQGAMLPLAERIIGLS